MELQQNLLHGDTDRNRKLAGLAVDAGVPVVATNDVHYHVPERSRLQDALVAAGLNTTIDQALPHLSPNHHLHLKSRGEIERLFAEWPEAVSNTLRVAEQCTFDLSTDLGYTLPDPAVPDGYTPESYLRRLCYEAAARRYGSVTQQVEERLREEFRLIEHLNLAGFLLLYREIALLAQRIMEERGLVDPETPVEERPPGTGARLVGGAARRVSHRDQPRRPPGVGPHPGALHLGGYDDAAGHRPRLPQGAQGRADRARPQPLRARVRRSCRGRHDLQGEGHHPGPRQGPGAPAGAPLPALQATPLPPCRRPAGRDVAAPRLQGQDGGARMA